MLLETTPRRPNLPLAMDNVVNARKSFTYTANNIITKLQTKFNSIGSVVVELSAQDFIIAGSNPGMVDSFLLSILYLVFFVQSNVKVSMMKSI
jgi:hypothetical protein